MYVGDLQKPFSVSNSDETLSLQLLVTYDFEGEKSPE
jgi:hypothetical protein